MTPALVLQTHHLSVAYQTEQGLLRAVRSADLSIAPGEALGLVGESGSGKTTLALGAIGYASADGRLEAGTSRLREIDLLSLPRRELRRLWGARIGLVSQTPQTALNPTLTIGRQLDEMGRLHLGLRGRSARAASLAMLKRVGMPGAEEVATRYPHQLSGGMIQRCAIAMALLPRPELLVLDEPTTSLDVTTQAVILDLLDELRAEFHLAILYITHNLAVVAQFCDRVAVMYAGEIVEEAATADLFQRPLHPYTANLLSCLPRLATTKDGERLVTIGGSVPRLEALPPGCRFAPRCPLARDFCEAAPPPLVDAAAGHRTACLRWEALLLPEGREAALLRDAGRTVLLRETDIPFAPRDAPAPGGAAAVAKHVGAGLLLAPPKPILGVDDVFRTFRRRGAHGQTRAVDGVTLSVPNGQTFGLVGESGSGKTTLARVVTGLTPSTGGDILLDGARQKPNLSKRRRDSLRRLQMVFQNPDASLNPRRTIGQALMRPLQTLAGLERDAAAAETRRLLAAVRLPAEYFDRYPGELSGGEKQRVAVARAFAARPDLIICDEPVSSLDVSVQGAVINLLIDLQEEAGTSYLFISHDLAAVQHLSHLIGVMYLGKLVEQGEANRVLAPPYHPYTESLLSAVPVPDPGARRTRVRLREGAAGGPDVPSGCRFHPRCPRYLGEICSTVEPPWRLAGGEVLPRSRPSGDRTGGSAYGAADRAADRAADALAAEAKHAICCHIPWEELTALQAEA